MVRVIMKPYHEFKQTMVESNIWRGFWTLAIEFDRKTEPYWPLFSKKKLRESAGVREMSSIDFVLDQLST
jgi:hypothetical protein